MVTHSLIETRRLLKCQRCGGQVLCSYDERTCLQCGARHTEDGKLTIHPYQEMEGGSDYDNGH